jgi:hypothetical protein
MNTDGSTPFPRRCLRKRLCAVYSSNSPLIV